MIQPKLTVSGSQKGKISLARVAAFFVFWCGMPLGVMLSAASCHPSSVMLSDSFSDGVTPYVKTGSCLFSIGSIQDARDCPASLGDIAGRRIQPSDMVCWCKSGFEAFHIPNGADAKGREQHFTLDVTIRKVHGRSIFTSMSATVVLQVRWTRYGKVIQEKIYRGTQTQPNMISGSGEIQSCFDKALEKAILLICQDAISVCNLG